MDDDIIARVAAKLKGEAPVRCKRCRQVTSMPRDERLCPCCRRKLMESLKEAGYLRSVPHVGDKRDTLPRNRLAEE
jgi:predicted amidophosphoribosyltransferase